jgi:hypothetical protein
MHLSGNSAITGQLELRCEENQYTMGQFINYTPTPKVKDTYAPKTLAAPGSEGGGSKITTQAVGEEGGGLDKPGNGFDITTLAVGEEGGGLDKPGNGSKTTLAVGEEGGGFDKPRITTMVVGEEGGGFDKPPITGPIDKLPLPNDKWPVPEKTTEPPVKVLPKPVGEEGGVEKKPIFPDGVTIIKKPQPSNDDKLIVPPSIWEQTKQPTEGGCFGGKHIPPKMNERLLHPGGFCVPIGYPTEIETGSHLQ